MHALPAHIYIHQWGRFAACAAAQQLVRGAERMFCVAREQLEKAETYDELWNAAQLEMVHLGKMHGFMRMYWAKKVTCGLLCLNAI